MGRAGVGRREGRRGGADGTRRGGDGRASERKRILRIRALVVVGFLLVTGAAAAAVGFASPDARAKDSRKRLQTTPTYEPGCEDNSDVNIPTIPRDSRLSRLRRTGCVFSVRRRRRPGDGTMLPARRRGRRGLRAAGSVRQQRLC